MDINTIAGSWRYSPGEGRLLKLRRMTVHIEDSKMDVANFGGIAGELLNGCLLKAHDGDGTVLLDFLDGHPIKKNGDWALLAGVDSRVNTGTGNDELAVRFTISEAGDEVCFANNQYIEFTTQDDLSALVKFHIKLHGLEYDILT